MAELSSTPIAMLLLALLLAGCTTAAWYEGGKRSAEAECRRQPLGAQQDCLARVNKKSYDDYDKERSQPRKSEP